MSACRLQSVYWIQLRCFEACLASRFAIASERGIPEECQEQYCSHAYGTRFEAMNTKHTCVSAQSLVADESFQHILRVLNTNVDGKQKIMFAMTAIRGIGRRFSNLACKKAEVDMRKR